MFDKLNLVYWIGGKMHIITWHIRMNDRMAMFQMVDDNAAMLAEDQNVTTIWIEAFEGEKMLDKLPIKGQKLMKVG